MSSQSLSFTETMRGFYSTPQSSITSPLEKNDFKYSYENGKKENHDLDFTLTIEVDDIDKFINDPKLEARAVGTIKWDGNTIKVDEGIFNLFIRPNAGQEFDEIKEMNYTLYFKGNDGQDYTFFGYKSVEREDGDELWEETTTLYTYVWKGHHPYSPDKLNDVVAVGILRILMDDFIQQLKSMEVSGDDIIEKAEGMLKFAKVFAGNLWEAYAPWMLGTDNERWREHVIPLESEVGVKFPHIEKIEFNTDDGLRLSLSRFSQSEEPGSKDVVLFMHGLTTSTDMYIMPEINNMVNYLCDQGMKEVWSFDWRGSCRYKYNLIPNRYTIDDIAYYDVPKAISMIKKKMGDDVRIHVIAHCVGSIGFMASLSAGLTSNIKSVISNSVSFTPKTSWQAAIKLLLGPFVFEYVCRYPYVSPMIPYMPGPGFGKWMWWMERAIRHECKEPACHMASFMWGWGFPAMYEHRNVSPVTHRRIKDLFGGTSIHYYRHIRKMVFSDHTAKPYKRKGVFSKLPETYLGNLKNIDMPPILFVSGDNNKIFPGSNKLTTERIKKALPNAPVEYKEFSNYGHQDIFMGRYCDKEVFPELFKFLKQHLGE